MITMTKRFFVLFLCVCYFGFCGKIPVSAAECIVTEQEATDIMDGSIIVAHNGFPAVTHLYDKIDSCGMSTRENSSLTMEYPGGIGSLYIVFYKTCNGYTIIDNESGVEYIREAPFLHDFIDLKLIFGCVPKSVTIAFAQESVTINELYAFSEGTVPAFVQQWKMPGEGSTDLVLFSAHGDDEHLFFAGILPYYAGELGLQVQLVYLTDHHNNMGATRMRETLDGLWAVGIDTYPVWGTFPDFLQKEIETAYYQFEWMGYPRETLLGYVVEQLRRFKPKVAIGHDFAGEYGHGQHMVYADLLAESVSVSMDASVFPESAEQYGIWDVPKTYFHLYSQNTIIMDWDRPLESFDGRTAFEVSVYSGFGKHTSQIRDFEWYYRGCKTAMEISRFNPCYFGLYRSTVGEDVEKNDFFENITTYAMDEQIRLEEMERLSETEPSEPQTLPTEVLQKATPEESDNQVLLETGLMLVGGVFVIVTIFLIKKCIRRK